MEHEVLAEADGVVRRVAVAVGDAVQEGQLLLTLEPGAAGDARARSTAELDAAAERKDLAAVRARHEIGLDPARPEAVARRHERGRRTARENLADLLDDGSFVEYGPLLFAAQEQRRSREELIARTPADGLVGGVGEDRGPALRGDVLRLHGPGGHPGLAQPPQEGPPLRGRRAARACRLCCSPRAAADGPATSTCRSSPAWTAARSRCSRASAGWCRSWASPLATASRATRPCSGAATW